MRTYLLDIIPRIQRFSKKLDDTTLLENKHWVVIDEISNSKVVYIFRNNNQLLISRNGVIEKAKWEYIGHESLMIEHKEGCYLFKHGFMDDSLLALKLDAQDGFALMANETNAKGELNTYSDVVSYLSSKYLNLNVISKNKSEVALSLSNNNDTNTTATAPCDIINRKDLSGVEMMSVSRLESEMKPDDKIIKSKSTKKIRIVTGEKWEEMINKQEVSDYFLIVL